MEAIMLMGVSTSKNDVRFFSQEIKKAGNKKAEVSGEIVSFRPEKKISHLVSLDFGIKEPKYIIYQNDDCSIEIRKVNATGGISPQIYYADQWKSFYPNLFSFKANGRVFIGGQNSTNGLFIQEVLQNGSLGEYAAYKTKEWKNGHYALGVVEIDSQCYLYAQTQENKDFTIRKLNDNGGIEEEKTFNQTFKHFYKVMGTIEAQGKTFLFGHSNIDTKSKFKPGHDYRFFTQEITKEGKLAQKELFSQDFNNFYGCLGTICLGGTNYLYGSSADNNVFFIQEFLPNEKKLGSYILRKTWSCEYDIVPIYLDEFVSGANWMNEVYNRLPENIQKPLTLKDFCMPASHDSGMYDTYKIGSIITTPWAQTQSKNILEQLKVGVRYFDFRVAYDDEYRFLHTSWGPKLTEALNDIKKFMEEGSNETLILAFTHFNKEDKSHTKEFIKLINDYLHEYLLERKVIDQYFMNSSIKKSINNLPYSKLRGRIIVLVDADSSKFYIDEITNKGNIYKSWIYKNKVVAEDLLNEHKSYMNIYDHYADTTDFKDMISDQMTKFSNFGRKVEKTKDYYESDSLMAIDWTLTPLSGSGHGIRTVKSYAEEATDLLKQLYYSQEESLSSAFKHRNNQNRMPNFLSLDYVSDGITDICFNLTLDNNLPK